MNLAMDRQGLFRHSLRDGIIMDTGSLESKYSAPRRCTRLTANSPLAGLQYDVRAIACSSLAR